MGQILDIITFPLLKRTLARKPLIPPACTEPVYRKIIKTNPKGNDVRLLDTEDLIQN